MSSVYWEAIISLDIVNEQRVPLPTQPAITCLKLTTETLQQGVKYVQS